MSELSKRSLSAALIFLGLLMSSACSTVIKPTRPSLKITQGAQTQGFRFDGGNITVRQPGLPMTSSRSWHTEVENYTARTLNNALGTDPDGEAADTMVSFELPGRSAIQIGVWKEMTISHGLDRTRRCRLCARRYSSDRQRLVGALSRQHRRLYLFGFIDRRFVFELFAIGSVIPRRCQ